MTVRQARAGDAAAIARLANAFVRDTFVTFTTVERSAEDIAREIAERGRAYLVCESGREVAGYATFGPFRRGPGYARTCEHSIGLAAQARGQGAGRALMERLMQEARRQGVHVMVAGISSANPGAVAFHERLGFETCGRVREAGWKSGQWLDLVLMQKILDTGADNAGAAR